MLVLADRCTRRRNGRSGRRTKHIYSTLSTEEAAQFSRLRTLLGMNSSQAVRFLILKAIAFEMGRRHQGSRPPV